jgi:hypothetical protein
MDVFYSGYDRGCEKNWLDLDHLAQYQKYSNVRDRIANTVVDESYLRSLIGEKLVEFQIYPQDDAKTEDIRISLGWPPLSNFTLPDGSFVMSHAINSTISNIRNVVNGIQMAVNRSRTVCKRPYKNLLLSRLDILPYHYFRLPKLYPKTAIVNAQVNWDVIPGVALYRTYSLEGLLVNKNLVFDTNPYFFHDLLQYATFDLAEAFPTFDDVLELWRSRSTSCQAEAVMYDLWIKAGVQIFVRFEV